MKTPEAAGYQTEVLSYFSDKAEHYDDVDEQPYWRFSDDLLWWLLDERVLAEFGEQPRFLDAGGGTGRWSLRILEAVLEAEGVLVDLSKDMISVAANKMERRGVSHRLQLITGDLDGVESLLSPSRFDLVICFHNVLGFVCEPWKVIRQLCRLLEPGGVLVAVVPNRYHTAYFNLMMGRVDEAAIALRSGQGRFTVDMPYMNLFTPAELEEACRDNGMTLELLTGFPVLLYPGHEETQLFGSTARLVDVLSDRSSYDRIFELERQAMLHSGLASRGNNLFLIARRPVSS